MAAPKVDLAPNPVSRAAQTPLHDQLRTALVDLISHDGLVPGDILPSEHQLCRSFGVSRTVVRQALADLENTGVVTRVRGKGTFVARPKTSERLMNTLVGLYEDVTDRGGQVRSDVLEHTTIPADRGLAEKLDVSTGSPLVVLRRMRYVDGEPWALSTVWMPAAVGEITFGADMTRESLYQVLAGHQIVGITGTRSVEAVVASAETAPLLHIQPGSALLKLTSLRRDTKGTPIDYFVAYHRGDRSSFHFELGPEETLARILSRGRTRQVR